ncbi:MAG: PH domain-containing protein [Duncaniella sp.]|nr:PH domain-containing protein [Duncaniella sp.]
MESVKPTPIIFRSAITWWLLIATAIIFAGMCIWIIMLDFKVFLFALPALFLCAWVYYNIYTGTRYTIDGEILRIKCGVFVDDRIKIENIKSIATSKSILSSPALSTDRIALTVNRRDKILISPRDRADFVACLLKINPDISVESGVLDN